MTLIMWFFLLSVIMVILITHVKPKPNHSNRETAWKSRAEIENMLFHAPAQKAIWEARKAGVSEESIAKSKSCHEEMCRRGGISTTGNLI